MTRIRFYKKGLSSRGAAGLILIATNPGAEPVTPQGVAIQIPVGARPTGIAASPDGRCVYGVN